MASFDIETPKGKAKPDAAELIQKMTLLSKAVEFGKDTSVFAENLRGLHSLGANARGLMEPNVVTHAPEDAARALETSDAAIFIDCAPGDFGFSDGDLKGIKKVLLAANAAEGSFDLSLPITAWAEREGTYTGAFSGVKLPVRMGPLPPENARSLRWVLAEALRGLGVEIAS